MSFHATAEEIETRYQEVYKVRARAYENGLADEDRSQVRKLWSLAMDARREKRWKDVLVAVNATAEFLESRGFV